MRYNFITLLQAIPLLGVSHFLFKNRSLQFPVSRYFNNTRTEPSISLHRGQILFSQPLNRFSVDFHLITGTMLLSCSGTETISLTK
jgi:hypothetical protein